VVGPTHPSFFVPFFCGPTILTVLAVFPYLVSCLDSNSFDRCGWRISLSYGGVSSLALFSAFPMSERVSPLSANPLKRASFPPSSPCFFANPPPWQAVFFAAPPPSPSTEPPPHNHHRTDDKTYPRSFPRGFSPAPVVLFKAFSHPAVAPEHSEWG